MANKPTKKKATPISPRLKSKMISDEAKKNAAVRKAAKTRKLITKKTVDISGQIRLEYDVNSPEFIAAFASYNKNIRTTNIINNMLGYVVECILRDGTDNLIEGVGYVFRPGEPRVAPEVDSGITIYMDLDEFNIEVG